MERLFFEFVEQNGSYLEFYREDGLRDADLNALQVRMLRQNNIAGLLPIDIAETDDAIRLRYRISDRKMLSQVLKYRRLTMSEYYDILRRTVAVLDDSKIYMLHEEQVVLHEDFMFVGDEAADVEFVYLPTGTQAIDGTVRERLKNLATTLIAYVDQMHAEGFQSILQYFYTRTFTLAGFKELLYRLEIHAEPQRTDRAAGAKAEPSRRDAVRQPTEAHSQPSARAAEGARFEESQPSSASGDAREQGDPLLQALGADKQTKADKKRDRKKATAGDRKKADAGNPPAEAEAALDKRLRAVALALGAAGLAFTLSGALERGAAGLLSPFAFLFVVALVYVLLQRPVMRLIRRRRSAGESPPAGGEGGSGAEASPPGEQPAEAPGGKEEAPLFRPKEQPAREARPRAPRLIGPDVPTEHYYEVLHLYTDMLGESGGDATGRLGDSLDQDGENRALAYLIVKREGELERVAIHEEQFLIGSRRDTVHYCEEAEGVSRTHLEIWRKSGRCVARDLGSRNGTYLNETRMAPYREYLLADGDRLRLAGLDLQFYYALPGTPAGGANAASAEATDMRMKGLEEHYA